MAGDSDDDKDRGERRLDEALYRGEDTSADIDPALVARIEAWFGPDGPGPGAEPEYEQVEGLPPGWVVPVDTADDQWRRDRALEATERSELSYAVALRNQRHGEMVEPLPPMELSLEQPLATFDLAAWGINQIGVRERERPEDLWDALREEVPQAILRDLHRPVRKVEPVELDRTTIDSIGLEEREVTRALIRARYKVEIQRLTTASQGAHETMDDLRKSLDQPWEDAKPENPSPWPSSVPDADLMRWFMTDGND